MISISYFKYDIVSDIKIIMPEKDIYKKYFNFCYWASTTLNYTRYEDMIKKYGMNESKKDIATYKKNFMVYNLTFREQFEIAMMDEIVYEDWNKISYFYGWVICHHIKLESGSCTIFTKNLDNVTSAFIQMSRKIPNIEQERSLLLAMENEVSKQITISPVSFYGRKLAAPYSDRCMNFKSYNFSSPRDSMTSCIDLENNQTKVCNIKIVSPNDTDILDYRRSEKIIFQKCKKYDRLECDSHAIFTHLVSTAERKSLNKTYKYRFVLKSANHPSYNITSKPKIDEIDLTTYILGALGSWIGFSFAGINPVPFFAQVKDGTSKLVSKLGLKNIKIINSIDREREKNRMERERNRIERGKNAVLLQRMNDRMLAMNNEIRSIRSRIH